MSPFPSPACGRKKAGRLSVFEKTVETSFSETVDWVSSLSTSARSADIVTVTLMFESLQMMLPSMDCGLSEVCARWIENSYSVP